ncbi:MAG: acyltransferase [Opitutae bacterium]|nr:acyltransferase [Opitutae bacterium]
METKKASGQRQHVESITILRGLAALGVVIFHVRIFLWTGWGHTWNNPEQYSTLERLVAWLSLPSPLLGEGVLLFFVISGFCVHYPLAGRNDPINLRKYAIRRFLRIYPPFAVAVGLSLLAVAYFEWTTPAKEPWLTNLLLLHNYYPSVYSPISSNMSLWSIPTEIEFYLAYPLLLLLWRKWGPTQSMYLFGAVSLVAVGLYYQGLDGIEFSAFTFYILWWSGALLAELHATNRLPRPGRTIVLMGLAMLGTGTIVIVLKQGEGLVMVQRFLFGGFFVLLIWWFIIHKPIPSASSSIIAKILVHLGNISFSLYLIHYPLLQVCGLEWKKHNDGNSPSNFLISIAFCGLAIAVAQVFYILVEKPSHKLARRLASSCTQSKR